MTKQTTQITTDEQAARARNRITEIDCRLADLDAQHAELEQRLGDALAAAHLGDKTASTTAGKLSLQRSGVANERHDLRLTRNSLAFGLGNWDAAESDRQGAAAVAEFLRLTQEARELEETFAAQLIAVAETAQQLGACARAWDRVYGRAIRHAGHRVVSTYTPPRIAAFCGLRPDVIDDPGGTVARWFGGQAAPVRSERERAMHPGKIGPRGVVHVVIPADDQHPEIVMQEEYSA